MRCFLLAVVACSTPAPPMTTPLASDGTHLRDADGRIALLRGVNARVAGVFDVTFPDGRTALEPIPVLADDDCHRMRALGLDFLRLPINWSALEPAQGAFDSSYLDRVDAAVQCAGAAGMYVMIDMHQDAFSKEIGEDGAPLWAIQPPPSMLLEGPLTDLDTRRLSQQVSAAFDTLFADGSAVQAALVDALEVVATRWADDPAVIGFELLNEPPPGNYDIEPFTEAAAARVRAAAPAKLVMFEPSAIRNVIDHVPTSSDPFATVNAVYAPHIYTYVFTDSSTIDPATLDASVSAARDEATAWKTPLMIGEYGIGPTQPNADLWMGLQAELHDKYLASDAFWLWKEDSQGAWGLFDHDATTDAFTERPQVVAWLSRVHAARIAGDVVTNSYDHVGRSLHLETHGGGTHEIYVPDDTYQFRCDGRSSDVTRDPATGLVSIACDGALDVTPAM